jgi:hypothetical protein
MNIIERLGDALFAFRYGLPQPEQERRQPAELSGQWFATQRFNGVSSPSSHQARYQTWLARHKGSGDVLGPFPPEWQARSIPIKSE